MTPDPVGVAVWLLTSSAGTKESSMQEFIAAFVLIVVIGMLMFVVGAVYALHGAKAGRYVNVNVAPADWYFDLRHAFLDWKDAPGEATAMRLALALVAHTPDPEAALAPGPELPTLPHA
jgi:hypothetical protein